MCACTTSISILIIGITKLSCTSLSACWSTCWANMPTSSISAWSRSSSRISACTTIQTILIVCITVLSTIALCTTWCSCYTNLTTWSLNAWSWSSCRVCSCTTIVSVLVIYITICSCWTLTTWCHSCSADISTGSCVTRCMGAVWISSSWTCCAWWLSCCGCHWSICSLSNGVITWSIATYNCWSDNKITYLQFKFVNLEWHQDILRQVKLLILNNVLGYSW